jgi:hypothetical protein
MADKVVASSTGKTDEHKEKYFSFQIKGWTNFDPMDKTFAKIAENIEQGSGFLTLVEVLKTENDLACIGDEEVRECFANILAAKRLVRTVHELPANLIEELRVALKTEEEESAAPKKSVASVANLPVRNLQVDDEAGSRSKLWP